MAAMFVFLAGLSVLSGSSGVSSLMSQDEIGVRLVGGNRPNEGRIEITNDGSYWSTICSNDDHWTSEKSEVICRQLGYPGHVRPIYNAAFGKGRSPVGLSVDLRDCSGDERDIRECAVNTSRRISCTHEQDMSIVCRMPGYLGCYSAEIYRQIQTGRINTSSVPPIRLNPFSCIESCSQEDYDYAVLAVIGCWCFTLPQGAKIDKVPTGEEYASCHSPCVWSRQYACGGESHIALYLVSAATCSPPADLVVHRKEGHGSKIMFGNKVQLNCHEGFILTGESNLQCSFIRNGSVDWNYPEPYCLARTTSPVPVTRSYASGHFHSLKKGVELLSAIAQSTNQTETQSTHATTIVPDVTTSPTTAAETRSTLMTTTIPPKMKTTHYKRTTPSDDVTTISSEGISSRVPLSVAIRNQETTKGGILNMSPTANTTTRTSGQQEGEGHSSIWTDNPLLRMVILAIAICLVVFLIVFIVIAVFICCRRTKPVFRVSSGSQLKDSGIRSSFVFRRGSRPDSYHKFHDKNSTMGYPKPDVVTFGTTFGQEIPTTAQPPPSPSHGVPSLPPIGSSYNRGGSVTNSVTLTKAATAQIFRISGDNMYGQFDFEVPKENEVSKDDGNLKELPKSFFDNSELKQTTV